MHFFKSIESSDVLIIVIDVNRYFDLIIKNGFENFLNEHMNEKFGMGNFLDKMDFIKSLNNKEIIVSLNKKDLLNESQLMELNQTIQNFNLEKNFVLNKISCINEQENDIMELLNHLKDKLRNL